MATISKFYLLDAASPNTGPLPTGGYLNGTDGNGGADTTWKTARDATDVPGASNPDIESSITANANQLQQFWGHRRFVSRPLAARTLQSSDGTWVMSYARSESNLAHNQSIRITVYAWRPSTGLQVGTGFAAGLGTEPTAASAEQAEAFNFTNNWATPVTINDGDILVFEVYTQFTQTMSTAYTDNFAYDGTTEASTTTCASFVSPPVALTLFGGGSTYTKAGYGKEHG